MQLPSVPAFNARMKLDEFATLLVEFLKKVTAVLVDQPTIELKSIKTTANWPLRVKCDGVRPPSCVLVVKAFASTLPAASVDVYALPSWTWEANQIVLSNIAGLTTGTEYDITLLIVRA